MKLGLATYGHEAAFGWTETGWIILVLGLILLVGAGNHPYRLMAAGFLVSPYLMPYNLAVLLPVIGSVSGWRKVLIWASTWLTVLGVGLTGPAKYLNLVFPVAAYCLTHTLDDYFVNVSNLVGMFKRYVTILFEKRSVT